MLLAEENAAVENKDAIEAAPAPEAALPQQRLLRCQAKNQRKKYRTRNWKHRLRRQLLLRRNRLKRLRKPTPVATEVSEPSPAASPGVTSKPTDAPEVDTASAPENGDTDEDSTSTPASTPDVATAETA